MRSKEVCESKRKYHNKKKALRAAYFYYRILGDMTGAYLCPHCKEYHLSHKAVMEIPPDISGDVALNRKIERRIVDFKRPVWMRKVIKGYRIIKLYFTEKKKVKKKRLYKDEYASRDDVRRELEKIKQKNNHEKK